LIELLEIDAATHPARLQKAVDLVRSKILSVEADNVTGIVTVRARTRSPELSHAITAKVMQLVDSFNLSSRGSQAAAEKLFLGGRLDEAQRQLREAEHGLQRFLDANREYRGDPRLIFEFDRLQRQVDMRQALYTSLVQAFDQASIESARNTPSIVVVEHPSQPLRPERRGAVKKTIAIWIGSFLLIVLGLVTRDVLVQNAAAEDEDLREFQLLAGQAKQDARALLRFRFGGAARASRLQVTDKGRHST
jgi:uncharacterized protein involved in exopolysaccharide biosynthesis